MQHVTGATHRVGLCLDVFMTRRQLCVSSVDVDPPTFSVHSIIVAHVDIRVPRDHSTERRAQRCWRQFDLDRYNEDLALLSLVRNSTYDDNVNDLFDRYDNTLRSLLNVHEPTRTVCIRAIQSWYDAYCREVKKHSLHVV